jgi:hypothetical protein
MSTLAISSALECCISPQFSSAHSGKPALLMCRMTFYTPVHLTVETSPLRLKPSMRDYNTHRTMHNESRAMRALESIFVRMTSLIVEKSLEIVVLLIVLPFCHTLQHRPAVLIGYGPVVVRVSAVVRYGLAFSQNLRDTRAQSSGRLRDDVLGHT